MTDIGRKLQTNKTITTEQNSNLSTSLAAVASIDNMAYLQIWENR